MSVDMARIPTPKQDHLDDIAGKIMEARDEIVDIPQLSGESEALLRIRDRVMELAREPRPTQPHEPSLIGREVRQARLDQGLTQRQLADKAGISAMAVRKVESGITRQPQSRTMEALERALGTSLG